MKQSKIQLAREIAKRSTPRFIDIPRERRARRYDAYDRLIAAEPQVEAKRKAALAAKDGGSK